MKGKVIVEIICMLFILLFVYAGTSKLLDVATFKAQIGQSPVLSGMSGFLAVFVPVLEIVISILLAIKRFKFIGLLSAFGLMGMFTAYIIAILQFSEKIPCACGGILQQLGWIEHLIFNIAFTLLAGTGILLSSGRDYMRNMSYQKRTIV